MIRTDKATDYPRAPSSLTAHRLLSRGWRVGRFVMATVCIVAALAAVLEGQVSTAGFVFLAGVVVLPTLRRSRQA